MKVTIHEAKTHLSRLIQKALDGEEVIIAKRDRPLVKLVALPSASESIRFGGLNEVVLAMDHTFDDDLEGFEDYVPPVGSMVAEPESSSYAPSSGDHSTEANH